MRKVVIASGISVGLAEVNMPPQMSGGEQLDMLTGKALEAANAGAGAAFEKPTAMPEKPVAMTEKPTGKPEKPTVTPAKKGTLRGLGRDTEDKNKAKVLYDTFHKEDVAADAVGDKKGLNKSLEEKIHQMVHGDMDFWTKDGLWDHEAIEKMWKDMPEEIRNLSPEEIQKKARGIKDEDMHGHFDALHKDFKDMFDKLMHPDSPEFKKIKEMTENFHEHAIFDPNHDDHEAHVEKLNSFMDSEHFSGIMGQMQSLFGNFGGAETGEGNFDFREMIDKQMKDMRKMTPEERKETLGFSNMFEFQQKMREGL